MKKYIIFGRAGCNYCEKAKILCFDNDYDFTYNDLADEKLAIELHQLLKEYANDPIPHTVPQIFITRDNVYVEYIGGYDDLCQYLETLNEH